jgi:hypothetical protein
MTTATDTDLQQVKDLITAGNAATQKQIADLGLNTQQQIATLEKQILNLDKRVDAGFAQVDLKLANLEKRVDVGFAEVKGELKNLDTKFDEKTKGLDQRITGKEFTIRGVTVAILSGLLLAFGKFLFFGKI